MEYFEAIKFLFNFPRSRIGPGTDSTSKLLDYLENPHIGNKYIHVTGANGTTGGLADQPRQVTLGFTVCRGTDGQDLLTRHQDNWLGLTGC